MNSSNPGVEVRVHAISFAADGVHQFDLRPSTVNTLPPFEAGAHIELRLRDGLRRQYSLLNDPHEEHRYVIAVQRAPDSRGGSRMIHETLRVGDRLWASEPRNHFCLNERARHSVLIAGGIGITPLLCMARRLNTLGKAWVLYYAARSRAHAAYLDALHTEAASGQGRVVTHFDDEQQGQLLDIEAAVREAGMDAHFYCCGPALMLAAFREAVRSVPQERVHFEYFQSNPSDAGRVTAEATLFDLAPQEFEVEFRRSGRTLVVPAAQSILDVALAADIDAPYSCGEGFCGSCATRIIEGVPQHRDTVLSATQRAEASSMMICCSRSAGRKLILDL